MTYSATWFLFAQEGYLAKSCLCNGLTALRHANIGDKKGLFYSAFFELSIGFERLLKLTLILDHMAENQLSPPSSQNIEGYGHNLLALFKEVNDISRKNNIMALTTFPSDSLTIIILNFLDDFAHPSGRYSNINKLTQHKHQSKPDPIDQWGVIASQIIRKHATPKERQRAQQNGQMAELVFSGNSIHRIHDLNQQEMNFSALHIRTTELEIASRHAIYALITFIAALRQVLDSCCKLAWESATQQGYSGINHIPDMEEFFQFAWPDRQYIMRKRRWP